jgi:ribonuclease E
VEEGVALQARLPAAGHDRDGDERRGGRGSASQRTRPGPDGQARRRRRQEHRRGAGDEHERRVQRDPGRDCHGERPGPRHEPGRGRGRGDRHRVEPPVETGRAHERPAGQHEDGGEGDRERDRRGQDPPGRERRRERGRDREQGERENRGAASPVHGAHRGTARGRHSRRRGVPACAERTVCRSVETGTYGGTDPGASVRA